MDRWALLLRSHAAWAQMMRCDGLLVQVGKEDEKKIESKDSVGDEEAIHFGGQSLLCWQVLTHMDGSFCTWLDQLLHLQLDCSTYFLVSWTKAKSSRLSGGRDGMGSLSR